MSGSAHSQDQWTRWGPAGLRLVTGTLGARLGPAQSLTICSTSDEPRAGVATSGPSPHLPPACTRGLPCTHPRVPLPEARADPALHSFSSCPPGSNQPTPRASGSSDCPKWGSWGGCGHSYECRECMFYLGPRPFQSKAGVCFSLSVMTDKPELKAVPLKDPMWPPGGLGILRRGSFSVYFLGVWAPLGRGTAGLLNE